jgi:hypothetical protein
MLKHNAERAAAILEKRANGPCQPSSALQNRPLDAPVRWPLTSMDSNRPGKKQFQCREI